MNATAALNGKLLFVNSNLRGRYESASMWKEASVIDVYNIETNSYLASFYVYNQENEKMNSLVVSGNNLYVIIGRYVHKYALGKSISDQNLPKM